MCGIFGAFQIDRAKPISIGFLRRLGMAQISRGRHAWGIAWLTADGRVCAYKSPGVLPADFPDAIDPNPVAVIGHTRWATHGDAGCNENNHPHPSDGGWIVHNGVVSGHKAIADEHRLSLMSDCDSEVIARLIEIGGRSLSRRMVFAVNATERFDPLAVAGLWPRPNRFALARRGNPVRMLAADSGNHYFGSLAVKTNGGTFADFPNGRVAVWDLNTGKMSLSAVRSGDWTRAAVGSSVFSSSESDAVCGERCDSTDIDRVRKTLKSGGFVDMSRSELFRTVPKARKSKK